MELMKNATDDFRNAPTGYWPLIYITCRCKHKWATNLLDDSCPNCCGLLIRIQYSDGALK
jgi:hypothetical protein